MSDRSKILRLAASLPVGSPERREILSSLAKKGSRLQYKRDGNVSLAAHIHNIEKDFAEDVAKGVLRYSTLNTPYKGKGTVHTSRGTAYASLNIMSEDILFGAEVSVKKGNVRVLLYSHDKVVKKFRYPAYETPSGIGSEVGTYGQDIIMGRGV